MIENELISKNCGNVIVCEIIFSQCEDNRGTEGQRNTLAEAILLTRGHHSCLTSLPYPTMASRDAPPCFQSPWTRTHPAVRHAPPRFFHSFWLSLSPSTGNNMNFLDLLNGQLVYALPDRCHYRAKPKI